MDQTRSDLSHHKWKCDKNTNAGVPPEKSWRAGMSLLLPGRTIFISFLINPTKFCFSLNWFYFDTFQMPTNLPCSVSLQPGPSDRGKVSLQKPLPIQHIYKTYVLSFLLQACGVDFEVKAFIANEPHNPDEVINKK